MMHNFNHYMEKISLLDGTRCVLPPQDLDVSESLDPTLPFGTDIIVDPSDPNFSADSPVNKPGDLLGRGWEYTYVNNEYVDKNSDLLIDCVPNLFEIGKIWGEVFTGLTGSSLPEALIID
jgi:hypothetical protein